MIAVITGDIINSRSVDPSQWMVNLKEVLNSVGTEPKDWEIYRGDSFQLKVQPDQALYVALLLKATINHFKDLDVRLAIGIGEVDYEGSKITESNGSAFIRSGECFETLKKETLAISTGKEVFDRNMNLMLSLATLTINTWTPVSSEIIKAALLHPEKNQKELAQLLNKKSQGTISEGLKRGGFDEIQRLMNYYKDEISRI
jgi:hypothetical protein